MSREYLSRVLHWIGHIVKQPWEELNRWQRAARFAYDLSRYGAAQLRDDRAMQMAAALSFQTLFALVPVLVVVMIVVRSFVSFEEFRPQVDNILRWGGLSDVTVTVVTADPDHPRTISLQDWLAGLMEQAANANLTVIGWVGFAVIVYSAVSMLVMVETSFNTVYRAPTGRPWSRRVPLYWFLITVSPAAITITAGAHLWVETWAARLLPQAWFVEFVQLAWSLGFGWLFWFIVYSLVPNTTVALRAAAVGALVTSVLLEISKRSLGAYLSNAFTVSQFYGSLGLVPLFMFWVYLMWLFILFGLEVSATLQFLGDRALEEIESRRASAGLIEPAVVVTIMEVIAEDFLAGRPTPQRKIADRTGVPEQAVQNIVQELCNEGLLHRIERDQNAVCLAQAPETITSDRLMEIGFRLADGAGERRISQFALRLREHQLALARAVTLASLLPNRNGAAVGSNPSG